MSGLASFDDREHRTRRSVIVTGTEVEPAASGASCVITTDTEKSLVARQASQVQQIELRSLDGSFPRHGSSPSF